MVPKEKRKTPEAPFFFLNAKQKILLAVVIAGQTISNLLDLIGVGVVAPFLFLVAEPTRLENNEIYRYVLRVTGLHDNQSFLILLGSGIVLFLVLSAIFKVIANQGSLRFTRTTTIELSHRQLKMILGLNYQHYEGEDKTKLKYSVLSDLQVSANGVLSPTIDLVSKSIVSTVVLAVMFVLSPLVMLTVATLFGLFYSIILRTQKSWLSGLGLRTRAVSRVISRQVSDLVLAFREIKFYKAQDFYQSEMRRLQDDLASMQFRASLMTATPKIALETLILAALVIFVMLRIEAGDIKDILPLLGVVLVVFYRLNGVFQSIFSSAAKIRMNLPTYKAFRNQVIRLSEKGLRDDPGSPENDLTFEHELSLKNVEFFYVAGRKVVEKLNLQIVKGTWTGIVGASGSGKSTLADLIAGMLKPTVGDLLLDGVRLDDPGLIRKSGLVSFVSQSSAIVERTLAENIAFGVQKKNIDQGRVQLAAKQAALHEFIVMNCPNGYETIVGDSGIKLTGNQRQRLALARALYTESPILILDELTTALDSVTQTDILGSLRALGDSRTIISVTSSPQMLELCDTIVALEEGGHVAVGTWSQLSMTCDIVRSLAKKER